MCLGLLPFSPVGSKLLVSPHVTRAPFVVFLQYEDRHAKWDTNQAGFSHSHQHGFGLLNAWRLVNAAKVILCPPTPALWAGRAAQPRGGDTSCPGDAVG